MAQAVKNQTDPSYLARQDANLGSVTAGSGGQTSKFVTFANLMLFSLTTYQVTLGTSTYAGPNGTNTGSGQQLSVIIVQNTSTTTTVALATTTIGPFLAGGQGTVGQIGGSNQFALATSGQQGGVPVSQGAQVYVVSGTDATAVNAVTLDYSIAPGAGLTV